MGMSKWQLYLMVWQAVNTVVNEALIAMMDGVVTIQELLTMLKRGLQSVKLFDIGNDDIQRLDILASQIDYDSYDYEEGDALVVLPKELIEKLNIQLE